MTVDYRIGDTRDVCAQIADGSVSLVATSPPFLALRSYLPADHPDKGREIGSEPDPATFIDTLLELSAEWGRVLAPWGSIAVELGDTYAAQPNRHGADFDDALDRTNQVAGTRDRVGRHASGGGNGWPRAKCLALIPQLYATSLAYGRNILTGIESPAGQWLVRNLIVWHRPNPAVGALGDEFRPATSYIVVATRSAKRWFDLTAVRTTPKPHTLKYAERRGLSHSDGHLVPERGDGGQFTGDINGAGAPPHDAWFDEHDTWTITTQPSKLAHYAMWPPRLAERLILSMCPLEVCSECGEPRRRIEEKTAEYDGQRTAIRALPDPRRGELGYDKRGTSNRVSAAHVSVGWTDCGCGAPFTPGVVLDPFAGTGTTLAVADLHGRDAIGVDIDPRNKDLYPARRAECAKALFGTQPELPGQRDLFDGAA